MVLRDGERQRRILPPSEPVYVTGAGKESEDELTKQLIVIDFVHHEIHEGDTFQASQKSAEGSDIADDATYEMFIVTGDEAEAHLVFSGACGGDCEIELFENTAVSDNGTQLNVQNMRRSLHGINLNTTLAYEEPTITNVGDLLSIRFIPGGFGGGPTASGGTAREDTEWVLKVSTNYLIRATNRAGTAQPMSILAQWYEEVPED